MEDRQHSFNDYYTQTISQIKWFEPYIDPEILEEYNNSSIKEGMSILDAGCGCSLDSVFFACKGLSVTAIDFASNAIDKLNDLAQEIGIKINTINASVLSIPSQYDNVFDVVSDNGCFHHIEPSKRNIYADQMARVLKPNGTLYIRAHSDFDSKPISGELRAYRLSSDTIIDTFFQKFKIEKIYPYNYLRTSSGVSKVWFIKLKRRSIEIAQTPSVNRSK